LCIEKKVQLKEQFMIVIIFVVQACSTNIPMGTFATMDDDDDDDDLHRYCHTQEPSATPCKQGNKQPIAFLNGPVKGRWREDGCKFNQSSNSCVPTIRYIRGAFSSFIQQQPFC
jgi:hypothetical protein